jgi:type VII secretion integral membrane protein EccD
LSDSAATTALVRVSVAAGPKRADLGIPGSLPVAEILPELARELGVLDARSASQGFRLRSSHGRLIDPDKGLAAQGIQDGAVLTLEPVSASRDKVYDDVVEAVSDLVETQFTPWTARHSATTAVGASVVFFLAAAYALFTTRDSGVLIAATAAACSALLLAAAAVLTYVRRQAFAAGALAATALVFAMVAGFAARPSAPLWGEGLMYAGAAMAIASAAAVACVDRQRMLLGAGVVVGLAALLIGALHSLLGWGLTPICAVLFLVATIAGNALPWLGISTSRLTTHPPKSDLEVYADVPEVERDRVRAQVALGHELMIAMGVATTAVMLLCTPQLVVAGRAGAVLALVGFVATLLRTRHSRTRATVLAAMAGGVSGLALGSIAAAQTHPTWRPWLALALAAGAALVVALALIVPRSRVRLGRVADALEGVSLVSLVPLAAAAAGVF